VVVYCGDDWSDLNGEFMLSSKSVNAIELSELRELPGVGLLDDTSDLVVNCPFNRCWNL
jgi:hypothetical protein